MFNFKSNRSMKKKKFILWLTYNNNASKKSLGTYEDIQPCIERAVQFVREHCDFNNETDIVAKALLRRGYYCVGYSSNELSIEEQDA